MIYFITDDSGPPQHSAPAPHPGNVSGGKAGILGACVCSTWLPVVVQERGSAGMPEAPHHTHRKMWLIGCVSL